MSLRCVVFDVDDTLYLERDYVKSGFAAVGAMLERDHRIRGFGDRAWARFVVGARRTIFDDVLGELGRDDISISSLVDAYRRHAPTIELLPDARACLRELCDKVELVAITDGPAESQRAKIRALGIEAWIPTCIVTAELGPDRSKPHPESFALAETRSACVGSECVYVADNPHKDFVGPKSRGWTTWRVRRPGGLHVDVPDRGDVDCEFTDLSEIPQLLERAL